jgi:hypothetical protein
MLYAYDITSSALYWPFPFADGDPNNHVHDSRRQAAKSTASRFKARTLR